MTSLARRAYNLFREEGLMEFVLTSVAFLYENTLRRVLPTTNVIDYNGVAVRQVKLLDTVVPRAYPGPENPRYEEPLVDAIQAHVEEGDRVIEIGGGNGVCTVYAAKTVGESGSVDCYEGTETNVRSVRKTARLNDLDDRITVHHAVIGPELSLVGIKGDPDNVHPSEVPDCDAMVLDCEGAEKKILSDMQVRPRVVIVETHGHKDSTSGEIDEIMTEQGYVQVSKEPASTIESEEYGMATREQSIEWDNYILVYESD